MEHVVLGPAQGTAAQPRLDAGLANCNSVWVRLHEALELHQYAPVDIDGVPTARMHVQQKSVDRGTVVLKLGVHDCSSSARPGISKATSRKSSVASLRYTDVDDADRCPRTSPMIFIGVPSRSRLTARACRNA